MQLADAYLYCNIDNGMPSEPDTLCNTAGSDGQKLIHDLSKNCSALSEPKPAACNTD